MSVLVAGVTRANDEWGANCGPVALAAALGLSMDRVRDAVAPFKGHMGVRDLRVAVSRAGGRVTRSLSKPDAAAVDALPFDEIVRLRQPRLELTNRQRGMAKACATIYAGIEPELRSRGAWELPRSSERSVLRRSATISG